MALLVLGLVLACGPGLWAQTNAAAAGAASAPGGVAGAVPNRYHQAQQLYRQHPDQVEAAWQFGRACFDQGELATNHTERAALAQQGIAACRQAVARAPNSAPAHYYLGLNLGQLARTETLGALKLVKQMEPEFTAARRLDERFDYAGADRCLGLLYRDAPSIGSIGNRTKARQHLQRAVQLAPDYPDNRLNLLESYLNWGERDKARQELTALQTLLPAARTQFSDPVWTASWADWNSRLQAAQKKLEQASRKLEAPRH